MNKPKPGVCGRCGHAVMRVLREPADGEKNGHRYEGGKLVRVRCKSHGGLNFVDHPASDIVIDCWGGYIEQPRA